MFYFISLSFAFLITYSYEIILKLLSGPLSNGSLTLSPFGYPLTKLILPLKVVVSSSNKFTTPPILTLFLQTICAPRINSFLLTQSFGFDLMAKFPCVHGLSAD
jgi:hypothetical protein